MVGDVYTFSLTLAPSPLPALISSLDNLALEGAETLLYEIMFVLTCVGVPGRTDMMGLPLFSLTQMFLGQKNSYLGDVMLKNIERHKNKFLPGATKPKKQLGQRTG